MAAITPRICWQNWGQLTNATLSVSSEDAAFPKAWLKDPLRSKVWKSQSGWTVVAGYNDKINITEGTSSPSTALATVAAGTYATGALMAAAISSALNAVGENTWACAYTTSVKFNIGVALASTTASADLDWSSGGSVTASIGPCLGFNSTSDLSRTTTSGTTSFTSQSVSYQSRHFCKFDLGADRNVNIALLHHTNVTTGNNGTVKIQAHTSDVWTAPTLSTSMSGTYIWNTWMTSSVSYRYWRFEINNTQDQAGFTYAGVPFIGTYLEPSPGLSIRHAENYVQLSEIGFAHNGAPFQQENDYMRGYNHVWVGLDDTEKDKLKQAVEFLKIGRPFFFAIDPQNDPDGVVYSIMIQGGSIQKVGADYWQVTMKTEEAIG
jgi:hypothetical protein